MQLEIEKAKFTEYPLEKISEALQLGLSQNYKAVEVSIVDCPNLREWDCPSEGISGNQKIIDVGESLICTIQNLLVLNLIMKKFLK